MREELRDFLPPYRYVARRADDEARPVRGRAGRQKREHLQGLAETPLVGEKAVAADFAEMMHPLDAAALVRAEALGERRRALRGGQHALPPRLDFGRKRDLEPRVVEQRKHDRS